MKFGFKDNCLYLHSAQEGQKIDILNKNNHICFEIDIKTEILTSDIACNWGMKYYSVIGFGRAHFIDNKKEKIHQTQSVWGTKNQLNLQF